MYYNQKHKDFVRGPNQMALKLLASFHEVVDGSPFVGYGSIGKAAYIRPHPFPWPACVGFSHKALVERL